MRIFIISIIFFFSSVLFGQPGTVALKQADGTLIGTYSTLSAAYSAIPSTVTTGYIIEFLPGYNASSEIFPIILAAKSGVSDTNRIIIRPADNNSSVQIIGNTAQPIIRLDGADYLTFDGRPGGIGNQISMKIENQYSGSGAHTIQLINGAAYNIFQYLHVKGASINTAGPRNFDISTSANDPIGNSGNIFRFLKVEGSRSGFGFAGTAANPNADNIIQNCEIFNFGYAGVWYSGQTRGGVIEDCEIYQTSGSNSTIVSGIITGTTSTGDILIRRNKIYGIQTAATSGSSLRGIFVTPATGSTYKIENNFISMNLSGGTNVTAFHGINFSGSNQFSAYVYYNSVFVGGVQIGGGTAGTVVSAGIIFGNTNVNSVFISKNNICVNTRTSTYGVLHLANHISNTSASLDVNYNTYYVPTQQFSHNAGWGTTYFTDLSQYQAVAAPNESNTKFNQVFFVSETDLHLTGSSIGDSTLFGTPIPGITTDIDGDLRDPINPYKGADEPFFPDQINWCNLQDPPSGIINQGDSIRIYAQISIHGITPLPGPTPGVLAWIGINSQNTNPSTWTNWIPAVFNFDVGLNEEYYADIGSNLQAGTYFYASKFQFGSQTKYGGYNQNGGGFWDGQTNVSGVLTVQAPLTNVSFQVDSLWNILSLPGTPLVSNKDTLFPGNTSNAYWFDGSGYVVENTLSRGKGYWLKFNQSQNVNLLVSISNTMNINASQGWNLIGTLHSDISVSNVTSNPPNIIVTPFYGYERRYFQANTLKVGKGYWVKTNQSGTLTLSLLAKSNSPIHTEIINIDWPSLTFISDDGLEQTLYFTNEITKISFELPPTPPPGSFDVRFVENKFVSELTQTPKEILISSNSNVVRVIAKGIDFILYDQFDNDHNKQIIEKGKDQLLKINSHGRIKVEPLLSKLEYKLMQNYPNPFNSQTRIYFSIPNDEFVQIKLFNILGKEIKSLINEVRTKGIHSIDLDLSDLPSGVYFYKISAGNFRDSKKLVLVK